MKANNSDFVEIKNGVEKSNKEFSLGEIKKGDICVMWSKPNKNVHFHSCGYDGSKWYSDYKQSSCNAYRRVSPPCDMEWHLFRHK